MLWKSSGALRTRVFAQSGCIYETALNINVTLIARVHPHSIVDASPAGAGEQWVVRLWSGSRPDVGY
jgi:hypothetical protein